MTSPTFISVATLVLGTDRNGSDTRGVTRPYVVHQLVSDLFGQYDDRPFLYRAEKTRGASQTILLLSRQPPSDIDDVPAGPYGAVRSLQTKPWTLDVPTGTLLDYEIRLNATKDVPRGATNMRSRRCDIWDAVWGEDPDTSFTPDAVYGDYLSRKLAGAANVENAHVVGRGMVKARKKLGGPPAISFVATDLIGTLEVLDIERLRGTIVAGIGRGKAFGCGLLCLSRPGSLLPRRYPEQAGSLYT